MATRAMWTLGLVAILGCGGGSGGADRRDAGGEPRDGGATDAAARDGATIDAGEDVAPADVTVGQCGFADCGGDPTGTWRLAAICYPVPQSCPEQTQDHTGYQERGTLELRPGGDLVRDSAMDGVIATTFPTGCLSPETCAAMNGSFGDVETVCDAVQDGACDCTYGFDQVATSEIGSWSVDGDTLTLTIEGADRDHAFCVDGDTLTVIDGGQGNFIATTYVR